MKIFSKAAAIIVGSIILSMGINFFLVPFRLLDGGMIGIGLILQYLLGYKSGLMIILCSIPIFIIAWFSYRQYFYNSLHGMLISSLLIDLLYPYQFHFLYNIPLSPFTSSALGGFLVGTGIGIMLRQETSTGGTDLLAQFLSKIFNINVGVMIFIIDAVVICLGGILISSETFFYSMVTILFVGLSTSLWTWNVSAK